MQKVDDNKVTVVVQSFRKVFKNPSYIVLAIIAGGVLLVAAIYLPNLHFVTQIFQSEMLTIVQKAEIASSLLGGLQTNFTPLSRTITIIISILFGIDVALVVYYFRTRLTLQKEVGVGLGGMLAGLVGVGCASCGSVVLVTLFGLAGSASILKLFPLGGQEFGLVGIGLLMLAIVITARKIATSIKCKVS